MGKICGPKWEDEEYQPSSSEEETDGAESGVEEDLNDERHALSVEQATAQDETVIADARKDKRFKKFTKRRKRRFEAIMRRAAEASIAMPTAPRDDLDCSENAPIGGARYTYVPCLAGKYIISAPAVTENGTTRHRIREMGKDELRALEGQDLDNMRRCPCNVCKRRVKNSVTDSVERGYDQGRAELEEEKAEKSTKGKVKEQ